jgi:hypothetical protein
MRFCPNCGNPLGGSPRYCAGCATQVGAENDTASAAPPGDRPPGEPGWAARHPSREPAQPPWPASGPPWPASSPPWPAGDAPWAVIPGPAAADQATAMITESRGTSLPGAPRAARPGHAACNRWHITLFIKRDGHGYRIRRHRPGFPADTVRACH